MATALYLPVENAGFLFKALRSKPYLGEHKGLSQNVRSAEQYMIKSEVVVLVIVVFVFAAFRPGFIP